MSVKELRKALDSKKISALELTQEYLNKIQEKNNVLNCYITVCKEEALKQADLAQQKIENNEQRILTGIPVSIKDNICTKGIKTTCASKMLSDFVPFYDATVITKLKNEYAVLLGKTNMDEFAMGATGKNSYYERTKNPYNLECITGGSSSGTAVSVSSGLCVAGLGSDTGGSVRQPAAMCGVTGLRPTYGTVSRFGLVAFASSLDQIGIVANSAEDCAYILNSISGHDEKDSTSAKLLGMDYSADLQKSIKGLKIALPREFYSDFISDEIKERVYDAVDFYKKNGATIIDISMPSLQFGVSAYYIISSAEAASNLSRYDTIRYGYCSVGETDYDDLISHSRMEAFGKDVKRRILLGNYTLSDKNYSEYYKKAQGARQKIKDDYKRIFEKCDVILTPTTPTTAYHADQKQTSPVKTFASDICTVTSSLAGLPAISTTCGYDNKGMPIGMSITARAFDDKKAIAVADLYERSFEKREAII